MNAGHEAAHRPAGGDQEAVGAAPTVPVASDIGADAAPFQVMPSMSDADMQALVDDIAENGVRVPIDVDVYGRILDGHHRAAACEALGIEVPKRIMEITTDDAARTHAFSVNTTRRHLSREQRRELIARSLILDPAMSDRGHAQRCGASPSTVGAVRKHLEDIEQLSKLDTRIGRDGRTRFVQKWSYPTTELLHAALQSHDLRGWADGTPGDIALCAGLPVKLWESIVESVRVRGILTPVVVTDNRELVDGRLRIIAAHLVGVVAPTSLLRPDMTPFKYWRISQIRDDRYTEELADESLAKDRDLPDHTEPVKA